MRQQNRFNSKLIGLSACASVALAITFCVSVVTELSAPLLGLVGISIFACLLLIDLSAAKTAVRQERYQRRFRFFISMIPLLLFGVWIFFMDTFGYFNWGATLFHLTAGAGVPGVAGNYLVHGVWTIVAVTMLLLALGALKARGSLSRPLDITLALAAIVANPMISGPVKAAAFPSPYKDILATYYVDAKPLIAKIPTDRPKNVLHILLESTERSFFDETQFGDVMAPLAPFEKRGFTAHNLMEVANTNHSIGGAVASLCGIPFQNDAFVGSGTLKEFQTFLPRLTCLGDVLELKGYEMAYFSGWPIDFLGQGVFYTSHGYDAVYGSDEIAQLAPGSGEIFGVDDEQVLRASYLKLEEMNQNSSPFVITMGLSGGHAPDGFAADACEGKTGIGEDQPNLLHALKCTNILVADFINNAEEAGLLDNTIVVIQSDHLGHESSVSAALAKYERRNLFFMYGPGIVPQVHTFPAAMFDVYPTILDVLGYELPDAKAGVGTSMLAGEKTLLQIEGLDRTNSIIEDDVVLRRQVWRAETPQG